MEPEYSNASNTNELCILELDSKPYSEMQHTTGEGIEQVQ